MDIHARGAVLALAAASLACAPAGREGDEIRIAGESAIIIQIAAVEKGSPPRAEEKVADVAKAKGQSELRGEPDRAQDRSAAARSASRRRGNLILLLIFIGAGLIGGFVWWRVAKRR